MGAEVIDTNVLVIATASEEGWKRPTVPVYDVSVQKRIWKWVEEFRIDRERLLVMDRPSSTIHTEYKRFLNSPDHYGRRVVAHKFSTGAFHLVDMEYWKNGAELVAVMPEDVQDHFHDLGDRKMVMAALNACASIHNATDGDWTEEKVQAGLHKLGVQVVQLLSDEERAACKERKEDP